ncbi:MAG: uridine kinase, partial [Cyanobacteria bacterium P01_B01_bin.77]
MMRPITLNQAVNSVVHQRTLLSMTKALLIAISGIDGSGKGYITSKMARLLAQQNLNIATINIDGWLNLPDQRFSPSQPAKQFYHHAIRFDELFAQLVLPLRDRRSIHLEADYAEETAFEYCKHIYQFEDIDVILLEGIYLLKRQFQAIYNLSFWIECSFETALS